MSDEDLRKKARRRALRAAQVVTLGLAMAGPGCGESHQTGPDGSAADGGIRMDAARPPVDQGLRADLGHDLGPADLGPPDMGPRERDLGPADMGSCPTDPFGPPPETRECCDAIGGWWDDESEQCLVAVPGPFVPPPMTA